MTAYLQSGDKIHLAVPITVDHGQDAVKETHRLLDFFRMEYSALGVTISVFTVDSGLHQPVVVAVFRDPPEVVK